MRSIPVSGAFEAWVDDADADFLIQWKWNLQTVRGLHYARRTDSDDNTIYMHRAIMQPPAHLVVDHDDWNGLSNQRGNLRVVAQLKNTWNRRDQAEGVYWTARVSRWRANISHDGRKYEIGFYDQREDAVEARAYVASVLRRGIAPEATIADELALRPTIRRLLFEETRAA